MPPLKQNKLRRVAHVISILSLIMGISSLIMILVGLFSLGLDLKLFTTMGFSFIHIVMPIFLLFIGLSIFIIGFIRNNPLFLSSSFPFFIVGLIMARLENIYTLYSKETIVFNGFGISTLMIGMILYKSLYKKDVGIGLIDALGIVASLWVIVPLVHSLPLAITLNIPFLDAFFESVMGFTGTGLTVFTGEFNQDGIYIPVVNELSKPILLWRSLIQWVGGIGVVVMSMAIISQPSIGLVILTEVEGRLEKLEPTIRRTAIQMFKLYLVLTLVSFVLLFISGLAIFDAFCHALTGISTAGFSTKNDSFASMNPWVKTTGMVIMILGASNFHDLYIARKRVWLFFRSIELRATLFVLSMTLLFSLVVFRLYERYTVTDIAFQLVSALTTTGWQSIDLSTAPVNFKFLLILLMFIGGSIFSTAGSIKILRYVLLLKYLKEEINKMSKPKGYQPILRLGRYTVSLDSVGRAALVMFLYFFVYQIGLAIAFSLSNTSTQMDNMFFEIASSLGNIGLSTGIAGASLSHALKFEFIVLSIMGRLEIFPLIVLLYKLTTSITSHKKSFSPIKTNR